MSGRGTARPHRVVGSRKPVARKEGEAMGIFSIKREEVKDIRRKQTLESLKRKKEEREEKKRLEEMERRRKRLAAEGAIYEARARKKKAKREAGFQWPILATKKVKVRKKRQGKTLRRKSKVRLL